VAEGDITQLAVTDRTGSVQSVEPWVATASDLSLLPSVPYAVNPAGQQRALLFFWDQVSCRTETVLTIEPGGPGLVLTVAPVGTTDCDLLGSLFAVRLVLERDVAATEVATRQVHEILGGIPWAARSTVTEETAQIDDLALALTGAVLDVPPRIDPGAGGLAAADVPGHPHDVAIAWEEPCGWYPSIVLDGSVASPVLRLGFIEVSPCAGSTVRGVTLSFVREQPASGLRLERLGVP
jgi:hypothetical protein